MIEVLKDVPPGIVAVRASGTLTREEYDAVVVPLLEDARREGRRLRCLCEVGADYRGLTPGAAWDDVTLGLRALHLFDGCAVVSDVRWIREVSRLVAFLMPCPVRVFDERDRAEAAAWLAGLPEGPGATVRLTAGTGVVVVEVAAPLRTADFEALAATVDGWLQTHDLLPGVVVHARAVPGWENLGALMRHIRFVRDHHRRLRRVALAVDGVLAGLAPAVADHFVQAQVRHFGYDALDEAIAWAADRDGVESEIAVPRTVVDRPVPDRV
jgi:SpoIIAA-like